MTSVNIAAITTGTFFGLLALVALVGCVPPITRFVGDLCCCPWRIPFTKKKRLNEDEEVDKAELPYATGEPRPGTPVDNAGYQRTSQAWMSALNVVDPELAKEDHMYRNSDYRRSHGGDWHQQDPYAARYSRTHSPPRDYHPDDDAAYHHHHHHLQVPPPHPDGGSWRGPSPERVNNYPPHPYRGDDYSPEYYPDDALAQGYADVQRPAPSHVPEMTAYGHGGAYFPQGGGYEHPSWDRTHPWTEHLVGARRQQPPV